EQHRDDPRHEQRVGDVLDGFSHHSSGPLAHSQRLLSSSLLRPVRIKCPSPRPSTAHFASHSRSRLIHANAKYAIATTASAPKNQRMTLRSPGVVSGTTMLSPATRTRTAPS